MSGEKQKTILLVDDEAIIAMAEKMSLEKYGYAVILAGSGEGAVDTMARTPGIDLILMDINLGAGMDGTEAAAIILQQRDIPIVFLSSHAEPEVVEKTEKITSYGYVVKNSSTTVLDASIKMAFKLFEAKTKEKEKEAALRESEKLLRDRNKYIESILDNMPIGFAVNTIDDGVARYMNANFTKIYGWPKEVLTDVGQFFEKVYPGPEGGEMQARILRDMGGGDPKKMAWDDVKITTGAGEHRYISSRNIPIVEQNLMVSTVWDSTQIHESQRALRQSEERYRSILNASPDSIAITDMEGRIVMVSPAALTMFGHSQEELLGHLFIEFVFPGDRERASSNVARMFQGGVTGLGEYRGLRADGSSIELEVNGGFVQGPEGRPDKMVFIIRDISERKRLEEERQNAETRYRLLFEQSPDGIVIIDPATARILEFNETAHRQLGYSREEFAGLSIPDIEAAETPQDTQVRIARVMHEGLNTFETRQRTRQGEIRDILVTAQFSKMAGRPVYHCIWRDITERKRAEAEIKKQLAEKEILLKEVHHRIKNNIASIGGLLSLNMQAVSNPEAIAVLKDAIGRIDSMRILYDKLLLGDGYKDISVKNYVESLVDTVVALFPDRAKVRLDKRISDFPLDQKRLFPLGIIINELLTNTMKYAFPGAKKGQIKISLANVDKHVTFTVQDNGRGLPDGFDIDRAKGFGLMLVKMLSQQLGGNFAIANRAGVRCTLEFDI